MEDLTSGLWTLTVNAFNENGTFIYTGSTTVNVQPGINTPVYLHLNPTTGSLEIIVTWGENPPSDYALNFDGVNDVVTILHPDSNLDNLEYQITLESWIYTRPILMLENGISLSWLLTTMR